MKIAFVVHDYNRAAGHSRYVAELATRFSEGHEVHVFANRIERADERRVIFHTVPALRSNVVTTLFSFAVSSKLLVRKGFDVVHSQGFCGPRSNVITTHICNEAWSRSLTRFAGGQTMRENLCVACHSCNEFLMLPDFVVTSAGPPSRQQPRSYATSWGDSESH